MGRKWGSNENIQIGDIFRCRGSFFFGAAGTERAEYYQVAALKGKTQAVLHAIHTEGCLAERRDTGAPFNFPEGDEGAT